MLVLGRKPGEYVMIGSNIMVKVVKVATCDLRLAIDAPKYINILRGEVYEDEFKSRKNQEILNLFAIAKS